MNIKHVYLDRQYYRWLDLWCFSAFLSSYKNQEELQVQSILRISV